MRHRKQNLRRSILAPLGFALGFIACGPGDFQPEGWMVGTFSYGSLGCHTTDRVMRYVVHEDGRFDIIEDSASPIDMEWRAQWEQTEHGRYRVFRDEEYTDVEFYPIEEGVEWEVIRSSECVDEGYNYIWHDIDQIDLATGERDGAGRMTPGAMCAVWMEELCIPPQAYVSWCEGTEPPDDCGAAD